MRQNNTNTRVSSVHKMWFIIRFWYAKIFNIFAHIWSLICLVLTLLCKTDCLYLVGLHWLTPVVKPYPAGMPAILPAPTAPNPDSRIPLFLQPLFLVFGATQPPVSTF